MVTPGAEHSLLESRAIGCRATCAIDMTCGFGHASEEEKKQIPRRFCQGLADDYFAMHLLIELVDDGLLRRTATVLPEVAIPKELGGVSSSV